MTISSLDNKKVKFINSLKLSKKRKEYNMFIVEGMHLVYEAYKHGYLKEVFLLENEKMEFICSKEINYVTYDVMSKMTSLNNPTNVIGLCDMKNDNKILGDKVLLLDGIQDPGNLGTIIRSACAFSVDTIVLSKQCVDLYNEKVIRSTQGMIFKVNIFIDDLVSIIKMLKSDNYSILGTDVNCGSDVRNNKYKKFALVMGNEGNGVSEEVKKLCDKNLYIKMNPDCESLNVGVATSILLYELGGADE